MASSSDSAGTATSAEDSPRAAVTVDDAVIFSARFADGPIGVFEATRFALGRKNAMRLEVNGSAGSLAFDYEDMNYLQVYDQGDEVQTRGFHRIMVTEPEHPYASHWWPTGHGLGYEHGFTHQVVDLVEAIADGRQPTPSFADALQVQRVSERRRSQRGRRLALDRAGLTAHPAPRDRTSCPPRIATPS